jgi:hypothetical protein
MSEFYQEDVVIQENNTNNVIDKKSNFEEKFTIFKSKYFTFKQNVKIVLQKYRFEERIITNHEDISHFLTIHNLMNIVLIYHDYFLCHKYSLLLTATHILEKNAHLNNNITSLSKDDKNIYISAYIFVNSYYSLVEYNDFIQEILDLSNYYECYCKNETKNMVAMIEFEETFDLLNI